MDQNTLNSAAQNLMSLGPTRVWSILVTVFGDLVQDKGSNIDGTALSAIMAGLQIKPEATRVALHRLRNDKWIASTKHGRTSRHSLTTYGRNISAAALTRIYGLPQDVPNHWQFVMLEEAATLTQSEMEALGFSPLLPRIYIGGGDAKPPNNALALPASSAPAWLSTQFEPINLIQDYRALHDVLVHLDQSLGDTQTISPRNVAVLRCAIVHSWRRLVLKHPNLPPQFYSSNWRGHDCRTLVTSFLERLPKPDLSKITPN